MVWVLPAGISPWEKEHKCPIPGFLLVELGQHFWGSLADPMCLVAGALGLSKGSGHFCPIPYSPLALRGPARPPTLQVPLHGPIPCEKQSFIQ